MSWFSHLISSHTESLVNFIYSFSENIFTRKDIRHVSKDLPLNNAS